MGKKMKKIATALLAVVFVFSTAMVIHQALDKSEASEIYNEAEKIALSRKNEEQISVALSNVIRAEETEPTAPPEPVWIPAPVEDEDPNLQKMAQIDLEALREENPDVVGWIMAPNTRINYPLMQGQDNQYYLENTWNRQPNAAGSIFLDACNSEDFTDFNTIIYGHNMANYSMFTTLMHFASEAFCEANPYIYIKTDEGVWRYEVFAAYHADVDSKTYGLSFNQRQTREEFLAEVKENSQIDMGIDPEITDRIITLSTCSARGYESRWVVQARLKMIREA